MRPLITLTTDFGEQDGYVAAMKGVLLSRAPHSAIIDLSHGIPPQDVWAGAFFLATAAPYFPQRAIHVVVVDPGVGTERRPIAARWRGQTLILPDNGLTTLLEDVEPLAEVRRIANPAFLREQISATFHGRDIFAPAAAALASGGRFEDMGEAVANWARLPIPQPETGADGVTLGEVIHIDRFGNCVTNIRAPGAEAGRLTVGEGPCAPLSATYGAVHPGETLALAGSTGLLELAVNQGNAAARHGVRRGMAARFVPGGSI